MISPLTPFSLGCFAPALPLLVAASALGQACQPYWAGVPQTAAPYYVLSGVCADDGFGPALFVSEQATGLRTDVFKRTGSGWVNISAGLPLPSSGIREVWLRSFDDGNGPSVFAIGWNQPGAWALRWNGSAWNNTPPAFLPPDSSAVPMQSVDLGDGPHIYGTVGPYPNSRIGRWNGSAWEPISAPTQIYDVQFAAMDLGSGPQLYAIGDFGDLGGGQTGGFARWNGSTWVRPSSNLDHLTGVHGVAVLPGSSGPSMYVSGEIHLLGSTTELDGVGRWDGQSWTNLGGPASGPGTVYFRGPLQVFDDGRGPALYITGTFSHYGGIEAHGIVRWDGNQFEPLGGGLSGVDGLNAIAACPDPRGASMFFCGEIAGANAGTSRRIVQYVGCPNCYANCDLSTRAPALNVNDFLCFMTKFIQQDPYANCTNDAAIDVGDFVCFMGRFAAGCP